MYVAEIAPPEIRNQAQGLAMLISSGLGVLASNYLFGKIVPLDKPTLPLFVRGYLVAFAIAVVVAVLMAVLLRPDDKRATQKD
jgi:MFS family permease